MDTNVYLIQVSEVINTSKNLKITEFGFWTSEEKILRNAK